MATVGDPQEITTTCFSSPYFVVQASCPLHGDASLTSFTVPDVTGLGDAWLATHSGCTTRPRYSRKRRD